MWRYRFGWNQYWEGLLRESGRDSARLGRVTASHGSRCTVHGEMGPVSAVFRSGTAPVVGDWVIWKPLAVDAGRVLIEDILPRRGCLARKAAGRDVREQAIAANVDWLLIVTSLNREFNPSRLERYAAMAWQGGVSPVVALTKVDLCDDPEPYEANAKAAVIGAPVHTVSAVGGVGVAALASYAGPGATLALVGSSGVGKSTLINALSGDDRQATAPIRGDDDRGRHTTTRRELAPLPSGGVAIDTPGMRELALTADEEALAHAFDDIEALALDCRFRDCAHDREPGCAVRAALDSGSLDPRRYRNRQKMQRELQRLELREDPAGARVERARAKRFSKIVRQSIRRKR